MKKSFLTFVLLFSLVCIIEAQNVSVESIQFGTDVQNREIVNEDSVFSNTVEQVYCLTHIVGIEDTSTVTHVWYYNNEEKAQVELPVRGSDWRTWSSKSILQSWTGKWSVDVIGPNGDVLSTKSFTVDESMTSEQ